MGFRTFVLRVRGNEIKKSIAQLHAEYTQEVHHNRPRPANRRRLGSSQRLEPPPEKDRARRRGARERRERRGGEIDRRRGERERERRLRR